MANLFVARQDCSLIPEANGVSNQSDHDGADEEFENNDITTVQNTNINNQSNDNSQIATMHAEEGAVDLAGNPTINKDDNENTEPAGIVGTPEEIQEYNDAENNDHLSEEEDAGSENFEEEDASQDDW